MFGCSLSVGAGRFGAVSRCFTGRRLAKLHTTRCVSTTATTARATAATATGLNRTLLLQPRGGGSAAASGLLPTYLTAPLRHFSSSSTTAPPPPPPPPPFAPVTATATSEATNASAVGSSTASVPSDAAQDKDSFTKSGGGVSGSGSGKASNGAATVTDDEKDKRSMKPKEIVAELDRFIIGQKDAKRAVAIALRNRWRRHRLDASLKDEVIPKNILMVGPTGVGKTEIARRLAKIANAPFIKVEATKFTEVGFHGRDVDQIIKDLVEQSLQLIRTKKRAAARQVVSKQVEERILDALMGKGEPRSREAFRTHLRSGNLEDQMVELEVPPTPASSGAGGDVTSNTGGASAPTIRTLDRLLRGALRTGAGESEKKKMTIGECRPLLEEAETEKIVSADESLVKDAIRAVEQDGIVFIDEIDKIANPGHMRHGPDASAEGVQRDLLPLIEGCSIQTKHGNVNTDHILFIASGAFHSCKPADLLSELQGRLPIRVELKDLTEDDFYRILTEPETNLIKQQTALMRTEGLTLRFDEAAIREIARVAREVNTSVENIGARRLHTVIERIVDDVSFDAPDKAGTELVVGADMVKQKVGGLLAKGDSRRYIL